MRNHGRRGFTLLELIIALLLSTLVLVGVIALSTQLIRNEYSTIKGGEVSAQTLQALDQMNRELENASYLSAPPEPTGTAGNVISGCSNYSAILKAQGLPSGGAYAGTGSADAVNPPASFYYCVVAGGGTEGNLDSLLRYPAWGVSNAASQQCPYNGGTAPSCTLADAASHDVIILKNMSLYPGQVNYFARNDAVGGIDMHFIVGFATAVVKGQATAPAGQVGLAQPVAYYIDSKITMAKAYNNTSD